jgi:hypothetical protein
VRGPGGGVSTVVARPDATGLAFVASVAAGSSIETVSIEDGCGNAGP